MSSPAGVREMMMYKFLGRVVLSLPPLSPSLLAVVRCTLFSKLFSKRLISRLPRRGSTSKNKYDAKTSPE